MRRRLTLAIIAVAAASVTLFAVPLGIVLRDGYRDQELLRLQRDTVAATRSIDLGETAGDPVELPHETDSLAVYDRGGRRVAGAPRAGPARADRAVIDAITRRRPSTRTVAGQLIVAVPLLNGERVTGAVRARRSGSAVARRAHRAWLTLAAAGLGVITLALLAALLLARRLARPLERVAAAARQLGDGDFSVRAPRGGISEVDEVGAALDAAAARLDDLISRERAYSANASHQLRTPLAALRLELETIQLAPNAPEGMQRAVDHVERLEQTITTLLAVARDIPRGEAQCDIQSALAAAEALWHGRFAAQGRRLNVHDAAQPAPTTATPAVVGEILDVVLDNAMTHGAGTVDVRLRELDENWISVDISDQGAGMPEPAESIFERRTPTADGHGIGLALARSLAHAEGGRLSVTQAGPSPMITLTLKRSTQQPVAESVRS